MSSPGLARERWDDDSQLAQNLKIPVSAAQQLLDRPGALLQVIRLFATGLSFFDGSFKRKDLPVKITQQNAILDHPMKTECDEQRQDGQAQNGGGHISPASLADSVSVRQKVYCNRRIPHHSRIGQAKRGSRFLNMHFVLSGHFPGDKGFHQLAVRDGGSYLAIC